MVAAWGLWLIEGEASRKGFRENSSSLPTPGGMKAALGAVLQRGCWAKEEPGDFSLIRKHLADIYR